MALIMAVPTLYTQAETPKPALPALDVALRSYPKSVPPVYEVDPATGKVTIIKEGYTIDEKSLWVRVAPNQIFIPYNNSEGQLIALYYNLRWKDHQDTVWQSLYQVKADTALFRCASQEFPNSPVGLAGFGLGFVGSDYFGSADAQVPDVAQLDFQAEVLIGYYLMDSESYILDSEGAPMLDSAGVPIMGYALDSEGTPIFVGQSSDWSDIVLFDMVEGSNTVLPGTSAPSLTLSSSSSQNRPVSPGSSGAQTDGLISFDWKTTTLLVFAAIILVMAVIATTLAIFRKTVYTTKKADE